MISIKNLNKHYGKENSKYHALKNINLNLPETGFVCILGQSGSGKTTLMNVIGSLDSYDSGSLKFKGKELNKFNEEEVAKYRSDNVGFIFQDYNVIDKLTVEENVNLALNVQGISSLDKVHDYLELVELKGLEKRKINELSGGQKQRVAIARALIKEPDILLCDEATGNVDSNTSTVISNIIKKISKEKLVIFVTHDRDLALNYADRIINVKDGMIISDEDNKENASKFSMKFTKNFGSKVSDDEVYEAIEHARSLGVGLDISINPSSSTVSTDDVEISKQLFREETRKARSAWKYFLHLAIDNIRQKKLRTFIVLLTFMMVITITSVARSISTYNGARDYVTIMDEYDSFAYTLELIEGRGYDQTYYYSGEYVFDKVYDKLGTEDMIMKSGIGFRFTDGSLSSWNNHMLVSYAQAYTVHDDFDFSRYDFVGTAPSTRNDIVMTLAVAEETFGKKSSPSDYIGLSYEAFGMDGAYRYPFTVTGIVVTDYSNTIISDYFETGILSDSDRDVFDKEMENHIAVFTNYSFFEHTYSEYVTSYNSAYYKSDLVKSNKYIDTSLRFTSESGAKLSSDEYIGNTITSNNEVLLSIKEFNIYCESKFPGIDYFSYVDDIQAALDSGDTNATSCYNEIIGKQVNFSRNEDYEISDVELTNKSIKLDLDSLYPAGAKIVGIYDSNNRGYVVVDEVMDKIKADTYYSHIYPRYALSGSDDVRVVSDLIDEGFEFSSTEYNDAFSSISSSTQLMDTILTPSVVIVMSLVFAIIPAFFMYLFNNISIDLRKKEIGILKSIGSSNNQVMSIFIIQSLLIGILSLIATIIFSVIITNAISAVIFMEAKQFGVAGYTFTLGNIIYITVLTFMICVISLILPYINFNKKPPINIVKDI